MGLPSQILDDDIHLRHAVERRTTASTRGAVLRHGGSNCECEAGGDCRGDYREAVQSSQIHGDIFAKGTKVAQGVEELGRDLTRAYPAEPR